MTTTTTFSGMEPGAKSSSRVLRPPGGDSSFSLGSDENTTPQRKNKMASSIFAEPDDPHAHRRNNPPTGSPTGTLCGEPSAPLRRCQQPLLFPKNPQPELTTIHNSGAALVWSQKPEVPNGQEPANDGKFPVSSSLRLFITEACLALRMSKQPCMTWIISESLHAALKKLTFR
ncbi:jupiter microtubule associated homolog 1-like [Xyrichtys novacula]|uniref:Jupiter microtubule associated homolog 1-like n=1 Tax=Xyrichtys novacula TaxID=13765 RepID=A0AAV1GTQ0_XYRNO|nr:jupiter microtubule associated homolog 1-like [Xyrichtys novacula]